MQALVDTSPVSPDLRNGWAWNIEECVFIMGFATWKNAKSSHFVWVFSLFAQTAPCFSAIFSQTRAGQVGPRFEANEMLYNPRAVPWLKLPLSHGHHGRIQRSEAMKSQELHRHHQMFFWDLIWGYDGIYGLYMGGIHEVGRRCYSLVISDACKVFLQSLWLHHEVVQLWRKLNWFAPKCL